MKEGGREGKDEDGSRDRREEKANTTRTRVLVLEAQYFAGLVLNLGADADFDLFVGGMRAKRRRERGGL